MHTINYNDKYTSRRIKTLEPETLDKVIRFLNVCHFHGITLRVTSAYRSFDEQADIYAKGRTMPGNIVSNARPGRSWHNYGRAVDVVEIRDNKALWRNPNWNLIGKIGVECGLEWGGNWKSFQDRPHFQNRNDMTLDEAYNKINRN